MGCRNALAGGPGRSPPGLRQGFGDADCILIRRHSPAGVFRLACRARDQIGHALADFGIIEGIFDVDVARVRLSRAVTVVGLRWPFGIVRVTRHGAEPTMPLASPIFGANP
jgi:hypothetical protein